MALGQAFIDVHADVTHFGPEVKTKIKAVLDKVEGKVKLVPDERGFRTQVQAVLRTLGTVKIRIEPEGLAAFRAQLQRELRGLDAVKLKILPEGLAGFRAQLQRDLRGIDAVKVHIEPTGIASFRAAITAATLAQPVKIFVTPEGLPAFRAAIAAAAQASPIPIPVVPQVAGFGEGLGSSLGPLKAISGGFADVISKVVLADSAVGAFGVKGTLQLQQLETALLGVVAANNKLDLSDPGDLSKGNALVADQIQQLRTLQKLAPSFSIKALADASKSIQTFGQSSIGTLRNIGLSSEKSTGAVKTIAQALVAAGNASDSTLQGAILPLLQAASTGKLLGQDLNQLAQRLPGIFDRGAFLDKMFKATNGQRKLRKEVALTRKEFDDLRQAEGLEAGLAVNAVLDQLSSSKVAKGALERQQKTVLGQFNLLRRSIENGVLDLFKDVREPLRKALEDISPQVTRAFSADGPLLGGIRDFVLTAIPLLGKLIEPVSKFVGAVNTTLLAAFRAIGPEIGPLADKFAKFAEALGPKIVASIPLAIQFVKDLAHNIEVLVTPIAALAGVLFDISQSPAGPVLEKVAAALAAIALASAAVIVLRGVSLALAGIALGGGGAGAAGSLGLLATRFRPFLIGGAILLGLDAISKKVNELTGQDKKGPDGGLFGLKKLFGEELPQFLKGAGSDIENATLHATEGLQEALTLGHADTSKLDEIESKLKGVGDRFNELPSEKKFSIAVEGAEASEHAIATVQQALGNLDARQTDPEIRVKVEKAIDEIGTIRRALNDIPDHRSTEYIVAADQAQSKINQIVADLGNIPTLTQSTVLVDIVRRFRTILEPSLTGTTGASISNGPIGGQGQGVGISIDADQAKRVAQEALDAANSIGTGIDNGLNKSGGGKGSKGKSAKQLAAEAFAKFLDSLREMFRHAGDFIKDLVAKDAGGIHTQLQALGDSIADAFKAAGKARPSALLAFIAKDSRDLQKAARDRKKVVADLELAEARALAVATATRSFADITSVAFAKAADDAVKSVRLVTETLDAAGSFRVTARELEKTSEQAAATVKHTGSEFAAALKDRLKAIKDFQADIDVLIKKGLNKNTIDQIIGAGVEGGAESADALAHASTKVIKDINATQKDIDKRAKELGNTAADSLFRTGKSVVDGLIAGLKDKKSEIADAMGEIAKELITRIRKDLKVHSPSRVMRDLFRYVGGGAILGLKDSVKGVAAASSHLARAAVPRMQSIAVGDLQAMAAAQSVAQLRGAQSASSGGLTPEHIDRVVAAVAGARSTKEVHATIHQTFTQPVTPSAAKLAFSSVGRR